MILIELLFAIMLAGVALIVVPLFLLAAGVAILWAIAPAAVLVALLLWLLFPHAMATAVLIFMALVALAVLSRRRPVPMNRWY
ncbi:MAG TPA: hypothetical protein VKW08_26160 [Xanthobacteraceae bacterium]|nr:hypothetical protein [Xanthobacteraceae bacterium]